LKSLLALFTKLLEKILRQKSGLKILIAAVLFLSALLAGTAYAEDGDGDGQGVGVGGFQCLQNKNELILHYRFAYSDSDTIKLKKNEWSALQLFDVGNDDNGTVTKVYEGKGSCDLSDGRYEIFFYPYQEVGQSIVRGQCADMLAVGAKVVKNKKIIFDSLFESCSDSPMIKKVIIYPNKKPQIIPFSLTD
jgi:hypothetical protein